MADQVSKLTNKLENIEQQQTQLASTVKESLGLASISNVNENNKRIRTTALKTQYRSPATSKNMSQTDNNASLDFTISATQAPTFSSSFNAPTSPLTTVHQEDRLDRLEATASQAFNSHNNIHQQLARITSPTASPVSQHDTNMEFSNQQSPQ